MVGIHIMLVTMQETCQYNEGIQIVEVKNVVSI